MADQSFHQEPPLDIVDRLRCMSFVVCVEAAVEIERLRVMAYKPKSKHAHDCDCIQCVPF